MKAIKIISLIICIFLYKKNEIFSQAPTNGLIAYYPFTGNAVDASGNGRNGVASGGISLTSDRYGTANQAYLFNGSNAVIRVNSWSILTGNSARSMSIWFKCPLPVAGQQTAMLCWGTNLPRQLSNIATYLDAVGNKYIGFFGKDDDLNLANALQYYDNRWHSIIYTYDGTNMKLYFDGALQTSRGNEVLNTTSTSLSIGMNNDNNCCSFNGALDDIRVYNRALSQEEIQDLYLAEANIPSTSDVIKLGSDKFIHATGSENTYVGIRAGAFSSGVGNTFIGQYTGMQNANDKNTFIGTKAGTNNVAGASNTFLGHSSGLNMISGINNVFLGTNAGSLNTGDNGVAVGRGAGAGATGSNNVFVGKDAGEGGTTPNTGEFNTFIGTLSGNKNTTGSYNTFLGNNSGVINSTGAYNVFLGNNSGQSNTVGINNTFIGHASGNKNTTGNENTFTGLASGFNNTVGSRNTFSGYNSGLNMLTGNDNVFLGWFSGYSLLSNNNVAVGRGAGTWATTGSGNVFIGKDSGEGSSSVANTGELNTFIGTEAGNKNTSGTNNVFIGNRAGAGSVLNSSGSFNLFLGSLSGGFGVNGGTLQRSVALGYNAKVSIDDAIVFGDTANINLKVGIGTTRPSKRFEVRAVNPNESGIRTTNLTSISPTTNSNGKVLTVNNLGDFILVPDITGTGVNTHSDSIFVRSVTNTNFSGGNLGIGVTSPQYKLDVRGTVNIRGINGGLGELKFMGYNFLRGDRNFNSSLGFDSEVDPKYSHSTAIGYKAFANANNVLILGGTKENSVNVGIGNSAPREKVEITSDRDGESGLMFTNLNENSVVSRYSNHFLSLDKTGRVGLYGISAKDIQFQLTNADSWADKVFSSTHQLMSLDDLSLYIKENKHLPNIPSANEMTTKGASLEELTSKLLEKIEEQTLYLLELKKELTRVKEDNEHLKKTLNELLEK